MSAQKPSESMNTLTKLIRAGDAAAHLGMIDRVRQLLDDDAALVHHRGGDGQTPLHVAATSRPTPDA